MRHFYISMMAMGILSLITSAVCGGGNEPNAQRANTAPLNITLTRATLMSLENNKSLMVQQFNPQIVATVEQQEWAIFDPVVTARVARGQSKLLKDHGTVPTPEKFTEGQVGIQQLLPTGTQLNLNAGTVIDELNPNANNLYESRIGIGAQQALLRNFGLDVALATVHQSQIDTEISSYEVQGFTESLVAQVQQTYWNYALTIRRIAIFEQSQAIAEDQLRQTQERIRVGKLARSELAAAEAEVALRREGLINSRSLLQTTRLNLLRLLSPSNNNFWNRDVILASEPNVPQFVFDDVASHVAIGLQLRPEIKQAQLLLERNQLELIKTKNGMLPRLDLFVTLGRTGYADSFGSSYSKVFSENRYDLTAGATFEIEPLNRSAKAQNLRATLSRNQAREALTNLEQLVEADVRQAYIEVERTQQQVAATAATRKLQEQTLAAEREKFRVGKSILLLVNQTQRDLLEAQIAEVRSMTAHLNAIIEFYRMEGTLLKRWGIDTPSEKTN